ncbi:divergent polysaccharide deacetylase family protein [Alteromonas facilis]|uniref:divergent polysaccharide deacetylase family protein n=1 Tax=Alteromonas facilis TaxID=2048004 RepID=UPI001F0C8DDF|nr:divergent polysaccharide deacetylase family protein [Alteromonas facilis]
MRAFVYILILMSQAIVAQSVYAADEPKVALIIDDMGYRKSDEKAFELPRHVTLSILPHTAKSTQFSQKAQQQGRVVMLHLPMETLQPRTLGPGALLASMDSGFMLQTFESALESVPHAIGVNNHMGSKLTQLSLPMKTLMGALEKRGLFFIDSRTTRYSKAFNIANEYGVPALQRKVFLDHNINEHEINQQFDRLLRLAHKYGEAVGIGHPHPETLRVLKSRLAEQSDVDFVSVTDLLTQYSPRLAASEQQNGPVADEFSESKDSTNQQVELSPSN